MIDRCGGNVTGTRVFDAIVVGSGAAGSFAAQTLTEGGLHTLLLEAGPALDPSRDFPAPGPKDLPGSVLERARAAFSGQAVQSRGPVFRTHLRHLYVNDNDNPYTCGVGKPFHWIRGRQVGGRLSLWGRMAPRMSDVEFGDWPIDHADLAPFYDRVEELLGLDGEADGLPQLPDGRYRGSRPLSPAECEFRRVVEARWPDRRVIQARVLRQQLRQPPLPLLMAERTGRLTLRPNAVVRRISVDPTDGKATGVEFADRVSKQIEHVQGRHVFLCASAFESVRILLNSRCSRHPHGIGGASGVLGRYIADHTFLSRNGGLAPDRTPEHAPARDPYDFADSHGFYVPGFVRGYGLCGCIGRLGPWWWMGAFGEMLARRDNHITLSPTTWDAWGVPAAHIELTLGDSDRARVADAGRAMDEIMDAAGLTRRRSRFVASLLERRSFTRDGVARPGLSIHEFGGARMGSDPASSVVDPLCRCWDAPNVIVTDAACFVSGGYQNPALTIMALSVRAAAHTVAEG